MWIEYALILPMKKPGSNTAGQFAFTGEKLGRFLLRHRGSTLIEHGVQLAVPHGLH